MIQADSDSSVDQNQSESARISTRFDHLISDCCSINSQLSLSVHTNHDIICKHFPSHSFHGSQKTALFNLSAPIVQYGSKHPKSTQSTLKKDDAASNNNLPAKFTFC